MPAASAIPRHIGTKNDRFWSCGSVNCFAPKNSTP